MLSFCFQFLNGFYPKHCIVKSCFRFGVYIFSFIVHKDNSIESFFFCKMIFSLSFDYIKKKKKCNFLFLVYRIWHLQLCWIFYFLDKIFQYNLILYWWKLFSATNFILVAIIFFCYYYFLLLILGLVKSMLSYR